MESKAGSFFKSQNSSDGSEVVKCTAKTRSNKECKWEVAISSDDSLEKLLKTHLYTYHRKNYYSIYAPGTKKIQPISKPIKGEFEAKLPQYYNLPADIIRYIQKSAKADVFWKLAHTCKALVNPNIFVKCKSMRCFSGILNYEGGIINLNNFSERVVLCEYLEIYKVNCNVLSSLLRKPVFCVQVLTLESQNLTYYEYLKITSEVTKLHCYDVCVRNSFNEIVPLESLLEPLTSRLELFVFNGYRSAVIPDSYAILKLKFKKLKRFALPLGTPNLDHFCNFLKNNPTLTKIYIGFWGRNIETQAFYQDAGIWIAETYGKKFIFKVLYKK